MARGRAVGDHRRSVGDAVGYLVGWLRGGSVFTSRQRQLQLRLWAAPSNGDVQPRCGSAMQQGGGPSLCLELEAARSCLYKDDVVAGRDLQRLPDARGDGDPPSGLDGSGAMHV